MTYDLLFEASLQVAMTWPPNSVLKGPNTVTAVDVPEDLLVAPPYEAYIAGQFWNREWVLKGARESEIFMSRSVLGIERKRSTIKVPKGNDICSEVWITLLDDPCDISSGCAKKETVEQLHRRLLSTLTEFILRLSNWEIWKLADGSYSTFNSHLPGFVAPVGATKTVFKLIEEGEVDVRVTDLSDELTLNNARTVAVGLTTCGCSSKNLEFVPFIRPKGLGETKCALC